MKKKILIGLLSVCFLITFGVALSSCSGDDKDKIEHHWNTEYSCDSEFHWFDCKTCAQIKGEELHIVDKNGFNECTVCKRELGVTYSISFDGTYALVTGYNNVAKKVRLAESYQGLPVKVICENAFDESFDMTTVIIPETVDTIEDQAFRWCYKLLEVVNNSPSITIEKGAMSNGYVGFRALSVFNAGEEYKSEFVNDNGFIVYTDGEEKLLVDYVGKATSLTIPNYITQIYPNALEGLEFSVVTIPESVTVIGEYAFKACRYLTEIVVPDSVDSIGDGAFRFCYNLRTARLGNGVREIGNYAFDNCTSLTQINIPDGVTVIGEQTFMSCGSLPYIKIPDSVTKICNGAFGFCRNLSSVLIGSGVRYIEYGAFNKCLDLLTIFYNGSDRDIVKMAVDSNSNIAFLTATVYYTLENEHAFVVGKYWYYDENGQPQKHTGETLGLPEYGGSGDNVDFAIKSENIIGGNPEKSYPEVKIIRTLAEFEQFCSGKGISKVSYDEAFFQRSYLIVVVIETGNSAEHYEVTKFVKQNLENKERYVIKFEDKNVDAGATVGGEQFCFVEVFNDVAITQENLYVIVF